ncbi:META domain-containing protein [Vibrio sp. HN007]|uniref:META domain-containing protein n=1 Tax=Vibrio iocasae TaxID=3098914 RepID=UPI0035D4B452
MKKLLAVVTLPLLMTACQSNGNNTVITEADLQHHNWNLVQIDGNDLKTQGNLAAANLEIGEKMTTNGNAGCNNFFGQGELVDNQFRIKQMGMTQKMCMEDSMEIEKTFSMVLSDWSDMSLTKDTLELKNENHTLTFKLSDWK